MPRRFVVPLAICSLLLAPVVSLQAAPELSELNERLKTLKNRESRLERTLNQMAQKKTKAKKKFRKKDKQENHLLNLIGNYRSLQKKSKQRLSKLQDREQKAKDKLKAVEKKLDKLSGKMKERRRLLKKRLRSIYKQGELMQTRLLLDGSGIDDMMTNYRYYRKLIKHDHRVIGEYRETRVELKELREERREIFKRRRAIRKDLESTLEKRKQIIRERKAFLEKVRDKKSFYRQRLRELENQQGKLKEKVLRFQRKRNLTKRKLRRIKSQFGQRKGELSWPVESREILRPYGTWRRNGIVHNNDGIDIKVTKRAEVRVVGSGEVVFANQYQGMGKVVIVRHNKKFISLYGSLVDTKVEKGETVDRNQVIGNAGRTSGMDEPRLYFQLFQGKKTLNPTEWLK
ncbi:MAG: murein hydrolase activator EnvC [bacterium]